MKDFKKPLMVRLSELPRVFSERFQRDRMIQLENRLLFSSFWTTYSFRALTLALLKSKKKASNKLRLAFKFQSWLYSKYKTNGTLWVIKYLKASQLALSRAIAGSPMKSLSEVEPDYIFPRLTKSGLPKFIPSRDRRAIAGRSFGVIRFWNTLFSIYRVLEAPSKLKLKTITDPFNGQEDVLKTVEVWFRRNSGIYFKQFLPQASISKRILESKGPILSMKSSPSSASSWRGLVLDLSILTRDFPHIVKAMIRFALLTKNEKFVAMFSELGGLLSVKNRWHKAHIRKVRWPPADSIKDKKEEQKLFSIHPEYGYEWNAKQTSYEVIADFDQYTVPFKDAETGLRAAVKHIGIGQLAFKKEPAGKIRVFAMVDAWTQCLLNPLHQLLFGFLRSLPNDGTFNQDASFARCVQKSKSSGCSYGYDLSAATDRLPVSIQEAILASVFSKIGVVDFNSAASYWREILVGRPYAVGSSSVDTADIKAGGLGDNPPIKYAVGQPMGALSSWAMLAVSHHMIVQYCAKKLGHTEPWYDNYEVLGDDIQIFDPNVAAEYLVVMRGLGVEVNEAKSVISPKGVAVEYAKRLSFMGIDVSAISWRMILSQENFAGRVATSLWLLRKGVEKPRQAITLACSPNGETSDMGFLSTSTLALLTSLSGKRGITLESLLMGLVDKDGKLLPHVPRVSKKNTLGIFVPVSMFLKKIKEFFSHQSPISLWFSEHWVREEAVESIEVYIKRQLNYEMKKLVVKLTNSSFLRQSMVSICTSLWPCNEDNIIVLTGLQSWVDKYIWDDIRIRFRNEFLPLAEDCKRLNLEGLLQPKHLRMMSLEKTLVMKSRLEGLLADITLASSVLVRKEPIPNSLKIIGVLMKSLLMAAPKPVVIPDLTIWNSPNLLQDSQTRDFVKEEAILSSFEEAKDVVKNAKSKISAINQEISLSREDAASKLVADARVREWWKSKVKEISKNPDIGSLSIPRPDPPIVLTEKEKTKRELVKRMYPGYKFPDEEEVILEKPSVERILLWRSNPSPAPCLALVPVSGVKTIIESVEQCPFEIQTLALVVVTPPRFWKENLGQWSFGKTKTSRFSFWAFSEVLELAQITVLGIAAYCWVRWEVLVSPFDWIIYCPPREEIPWDQVDFFFTWLAVVAQQ